MSRTRAGSTAAKLIPLRADVILGNVQAHEALLDIALDVDWSLALNENYQALEFAARPILHADATLFKRFGLYDKQGHAVKLPGKAGFALKPKTAAKYHAERAALLAKVYQVRLTPIKRSAFPRKIDGKPIAIAGKTWALLGPLLVD